ncbi:hypothetical protein FH972_011342 [Carpinus fangiana]|uniref:FAS1 domain-containing protein n=1 Tax=Carpinus fangiana TaxID=176857 RepID=A0A660KR03_9ROSI|nr:hypothetical protein FH972_011342 [Carpinus fangiana]
MHAKMTKLQAVFSLSLVFLCLCSKTLGQAPVQAPAQAPSKPADTPAPRGTPDVTKILQKAGGFTILLRLLRTTAVADQIKGQLDNSDTGFTLFAPTDSAFSNLKSGTLNSLSNEEKIRLMQFHTLPKFYSLENFETVTNPVRTQAGDTKPGDYPLNLTAAGGQVNISTGLVNATVSGTLFSAKQLAVYRVDKVLLPLDIFVPKPPAPAPAPVKPKAKKAAASPKSSSSTTTTPPLVVDSGAVGLTEHGMLVSVGFSVFIAAFSLR